MKNDSNDSKFNKTSIQANLVFLAGYKQQD